MLITNTLKTIKQTNFTFPGQTDFARGKVRDIYFFNDKVAVVTTDRLSAFDHILSKTVPQKGRILNLMAAASLQESAHIVPNWLLEVPDPNVSFGWRCTPFPVEMVIRGYLAGHALREYREGKREICGEPLEEGLQSGDPLPEPIITPTIKSKNGHDEDISKADIISQGLISTADYEQLENHTRALFKFGTEKAAEKGLILADTKYEFGKHNDKIVLIDEVHTPDSSRYYYAEGYEERQRNGKSQKQLSKEFVREKLVTLGFRGSRSRPMPELPDEFILEVTDRYLELYRRFIGKDLPALPDEESMSDRIEKAILQAIKN